MGAQILGSLAGLPVRGGLLVVPHTLGKTPTWVGVSAIRQRNIFGRVVTRDPVVVGTSGTSVTVRILDRRSRRPRRGRLLSGRIEVFA